MANKLGKGEFPAGHSADDFECFGPPATKDGAFDGTKIADLGCFTQDGRDSNKSYHGSVVKSKKTSKWFAYFEWGRTGSKNPDCQFVECDNEEEACEEYCSQLRSKNDKRGEWVTIAGLKTLRAKAGKDCYLVRAQATRSTGLPSARTIKMNDGAKKTISVTDPKKPVAKTNGPKIDHQTMSLMRDLNVATVAYTKGSMADASIPTQVSIDEARQILAEAMTRCVKVGDDASAQARDPKMRDLTNFLYSRIPKTKPVGAPIETWTLSKNNILGWQADLDSFESALYSTSIECPDDNPLSGMDLEMSWIDPASSIGEWVKRWASGATRKKHHYGAMRIHNIWRIRKPSSERQFHTKQEAIAKEKPSTKECALFQAKRPDLNERDDIYNAAHTALLFHGTRSVNTSGILRKSLLLPKQLVGVSITGALYGPGIYFADDWCKSAGYTSLKSSYWSGGGGGVKGRNAFMFLADVVLGTPHVATSPQGYYKAPSGCHSVFGKGGYSGLGSGNSLQNNEWIVYESAQHCLRYLIEFEA